MTYIEDDDLLDLAKLLTLGAQVVPVLVQHQRVFLRGAVNKRGTIESAEHGGQSLNKASKCVRVCPHFEVAWMEHVLDDDNLLKPLPHFSLFLRPPVQLPARDTHTHTIPQLRIPAPTRGRHTT